MSSHYNSNQKKCWSCKYYYGERKYKNGLIGNYVDTNEKGVCKCKRDEIVEENGWCSKWDIADEVIKFKAYEEEKNKIKEQRAQEKREQKAEEKRQYDAWFNSLSQEQKEEETKKINEKRKKKTE